MSLYDNDNIKTKEELEKIKREQEEQRRRAAKIAELKLEISELEKLKAEYEKLKTDLTTISSGLSDLNNNLSSCSTSLSQALVIDGIAVGNNTMKETAKNSKTYASNLSWSQGLISLKLIEINLKLSSKNAELNRYI